MWLEDEMEGGRPKYCCGLPMVSAGVGTQSDDGKIDWWNISKMLMFGVKQRGTETAG